MLFPPAVETLQRVRDCCDVMQGCARESSRTGDCSANQPLLADLFSLLRRRKEKKKKRLGSGSCRHKRNAFFFFYSSVASFVVFQLDRSNTGYFVLYRNLLAESKGREKKDST